MKIEIEKIYKDLWFGGKITIQAGKEGWLIIFRDDTFEGVHEVIVENNFEQALSVLENSFPGIREVENK